ncbi:alpha-ketoglutarate-dependent dioxygenase alkB homolog 4 [Galendromus occidentalis]|uniref:Alpha-ketoglutarate-dependent dioxygenase alkB homolog 4 n=1 Tax=Galendromus occidentalis TaxID=34638 RepID=A0AAJ7SIT6_9ACAR|nr:alpha-ketoglutarate-dependent dioxygenase alkB homolog 4 [Galendromus occidentalis]
MGASCQCKGVRACALCEHDRVASHRLNVSRIGRAFVFCPKCKLCIELDPQNGELGASSFRLEGIEVAENAITEDHEKFLVDAIESAPWKDSQSGRLKQDFGPKVNFKKRKVKCDSFLGFPAYMDVVQMSFSRIPGLNDFVPVELCNLKYSPERGSCIDPHFDDSWLWGERLVTLNLLGQTVLTFSQAQDFDDLTQKQTHYDAHGCGSEQGSEALGTRNKCQPMDVVHVLLPRRSLVTVARAARSEWHHSILREHVTETRLAMTCRELSETFLDVNNAESEQGKILLEKARVNPEL